MRVLIIEDDITLCESLKIQLEQQNMSVDVCHNGEDGLHLIRDRIHDIILLDRMMPLMDGFEVLRQMRREQISAPVILVTALGEINDRIEGLDLGADDYIVKPFAFGELMARIRCIGRRPQKWENNQMLCLEDITYDPVQRKLSLRDAAAYTLSKREGDLLEFFMKNPNQTLPRSAILIKVWGPDEDVGEGNLDNYIHFLRRRLKGIGSSLTLKTVRGIGYCLEALHV